MTAAVLPPAGYHRPDMVGADGLSVAVVHENGDESAFDFAGIAAPDELVRALVAGFADAAGPGGPWKARDTVQQAATVLRRLARDVSAANPRVGTSAEVTPEVWWGWRTVVEEGARSPGQINMARVLLRHVDGVPETTLRATNTKAPKPPRLYDAYSRDEFKRIRSAAWRVVNAARTRIDANLKHLERHRAGDTPARSARVRIRGKTWTTGALLEYLSRTGTAPYCEGVRSNTTQPIRAPLGLAAHRPITVSLFLRSTEVYALMILFICDRGYNVAPLNSMTVSGGRADDRDADPPVHLVDMEKPRRGAGRHFSNPFAGKSAVLWELAVSLTQPARDTLDALGHPTDKLFVAVNQGRPSTDDCGLFRTDWSPVDSAAKAWRRTVEIADDHGAPLTVSLRRLRLSEQVINERASQNTEAVSAKVYRAPDPQTHAKAREVVLQGQADAVEHAHATVQMRTISGSELAAARTNPNGLARKLGVKPDRVALLVQGGLDTASGACLNYDNSPFAEPGEPCRASFLNCLACPNAVATVDHLPRLVVLHDALVGIAGVVAQPEWQQHYAEHLARLQDLLRQCSTDKEVTQARNSATDADRATVEALLRGGFDR